MLVHIALCVCMHQYLGCCWDPSKALTLSFKYTESKDIDVGTENKNKNKNKKTTNQPQSKTKQLRDAAIHLQIWQFQTGHTVFCNHSMGVRNISEATLELNEILMCHSIVVQALCWNVCLRMFCTFGKMTEMTPAILPSEGICFQAICSILSTM